MLNKIIRKGAFPVFLVCLLLILIFSLIPQPLPPMPDVPWTDKILHFIAYAALGFSLTPVLFFRLENRFSRGKRKRAVVVRVLIFALLFGGAIEILQRYTGRYPELPDLLADGLGGLAGSALALLILSLVNPDRKG